MRLAPYVLLSILYLRCSSVSWRNRGMSRAAFNSLFEMLVPNNALALNDDTYAFNSLFEMPSLVLTVLVAPPSSLSILYLRCRDAEVCEVPAAG